MNNRNFIVLGLTLGALSALFILLSPKHPKFGVIDTGFIVAEQAKTLAKNNPNTTFTPQKIRQVTDNLKEQVDSFCHQSNLILISKGAVWGGDLKDYTQEVYAELNLSEVPE